ncbi:MAG: hypothetical protein ACXWWJ_01680, partial [Nitrospira sp.]
IRRVHLPALRRKSLQVRPRGSAEGAYSDLPGRQSLNERLSRCIRSNSCRTTPHLNTFNGC